MARPTASLTLYLQSVGRGMRTSPGKTDLLILDHAGNIERHGAPDEKRHWSLESDAQKAKREAEVAELERLGALSYESIEAELEAKRREREEIAREWMTADEISDRLKAVGMRTSSSSASAWIKARGISGRRSPLHGRNCIYNRAEVETAIPKDTMGQLSCDWMTVAEVRERATSAGFNLRKPDAWATTRGIRTRVSPADSRQFLYHRSEVESAMPSWSAADMQVQWMENVELFARLKAVNRCSKKGGISGWAKRSGVTTHDDPGNSQYRLYNRKEVEAALAKYGETSG